MKEEKKTSVPGTGKNKARPLIAILIAVVVLAAGALVWLIAQKSSRTHPDYFSIEEGVLLAYTGTDRTVTIPDGVVVVGERVFMNHAEIEKVVFPATLTTLRNGAFYGCSGLREIRFNRGLSFIGDAAFGECTSLTSFELPASVQYIHSEALYSCDAVESITVADGNEKFESRDGVLYADGGKTLVLYPAGRKDVSFTVPADVETIAMGAFFGTVALEEIDLSNVQYIGDSAFSYCVNLKTVHFPASLVQVYDSAFADCLMLTEVTGEPGVQILGASVFGNCVSLARAELPEGLEELGFSCFVNCASLSEATLPSSLTEIPNNAFDGCENVKIRCHAGSTAETFAIFKMIPFETLD